MRRWLAAAASLLWSFSAFGQAPNFPITMPADTVYGAQFVSGPGVAIPFSVLAQRLFSSQVPFPFPNPIAVGGGAPLSLSAGSPPVTAVTTQFIPLLPSATGAPVVAIERSRTFNDGAIVTSSPTLYVATKTDLGSTPGSYGNGFLSEVSITSNAATTGQGYMEAIRGFCGIANGIANRTSCWGGVSVAFTGASPYISLIGLEGDATQFNADAPTPVNYNPSAFKVAASFLASCGTGGGNICDWAYGVNAYGVVGHQAGFICPKEATPGATIKYGCFVAASSAPYGLDLHLGTWSSAAIYLPNMGAVIGRNAANNADVNMMFLDAANTVVMGSPLKVNGSFFNVQAASGGVTMNIVSGTAGSNSQFQFYQTATPYWQVGNSGANAFFIFDNQFNSGAGRVDLSIASTGDMTLMGSGGNVIYPASTGTPAASLCLDASNKIIKKTTTGPCV